METAEERMTQDTYVKFRGREHDLKTHRLSYAKDYEPRLRAVFGDQRAQEVINAVDLILYGS